MTQNNFKLHIEGPDAEEAAKKMSELIENEFGQKPVRITPEQREIIPDQGDDVAKIDPAAIAALILTIPSALLAVRDLSERFRKKESVDLMIRVAGELRENYPSMNISITAPKGVTVKLDMAKSEDILSAASETK